MNPKDLQTRSRRNGEVELNQWTSQHGHVCPRAHSRTNDAVFPADELANICTSNRLIHPPSQLCAHATPRTGSVWSGNSIEG